MDKLEYIPGDLAFHYIPKTTIKKYVKVYVCSTNNALSLEDMDGKLYDYIGELYPIPLTPEILEKNGWKQNGGQYSFTYKPYAGDKVELIGFFIEMFKDVHDMLKHRYFQITHEDKVICGCFYVHQLQHLLFGLGINHKMEV